MLMTEVVVTVMTIVKAVPPGEGAADDGGSHAETKDSMAKLVLPQHLAKKSAELLQVCSLLERA